MRVWQSRCTWMVVRSVLMTTGRIKVENTHSNFLRWLLPSFHTDNSPPPPHVQSISSSVSRWPPLTSVLLTPKSTNSVCLWPWSCLFTVWCSHIKQFRQPYLKKKNASVPIFMMQVELFRQEVKYKKTWWTRMIFTITHDSCIWFYMCSILLWNAIVKLLAVPLDFSLIEQI